MFNQLKKITKTQFWEWLVGISIGMTTAFVFVLLFLAIPSCSDIFISRWDNYNQAQIDKIERYTQKQAEQGLLLRDHINREKKHEMPNMRQNE